MDKREKRMQARVSDLPSSAISQLATTEMKRMIIRNERSVFYPSRLFPLGRATGLRSGTIAPAEVGAFC